MSNIPATMRAVLADPPGGAEALKIITAPVPVPAPGEVLIKVAAAGVNRPDIMQRNGKYDPPKGTTPILGLEVAGQVALAPVGSRWKTGDKVCALLAGGGYAEYAAAPEGQCLPWPENLSATEAACLPEGLFTTYANLFEHGGLKAGETALVHGGTSGIGHYAIQLTKIFGAKIIVTVGDDDKAAFCRQLGADHAINYHKADFADEVLKLTSNHGVDVVLDMIGGDYIAKNISCMAPKGRHVSIAAQKGKASELDIWQIMKKQLVLTGSTMRPRPVAEKARLAWEIEARLWPKIVAGALKPHVFQAFPLEKVAEAHKLMESGRHRGKVALTVGF